MKYVSLLLHWYQPPTQDISLVRRIDGECYTPVSELLSRTGAPVGVNINYSLTEQLAAIGSSTPGNLRQAVGVEFTDSGAYHPIFPLIRQEDVTRQLGLNRKGNSELIGSSFAPTGVFPPEMAWAPSLAPLLSGLGYTWTVTDDLPWSWAGNAVPFDSVPRMGGLSVLLRSNFWSNRISFHGVDGGETVGELTSGMNSWAGDGDSYVLISMDVETYGHHRPGMVESFLGPFLNGLMEDEGVDLVVPGRLPELFPPLDCEVPAGSWSTSPADLDSGKPWPLWGDPDNEVHIGLRRVLDMVCDASRLCGWERVAPLADKMLYSCPFWWADRGRFCGVQVRRGLLLMLETARAVLAETGDRTMMDDIMTAACGIPVITGEDTDDAQEGKDLRSEAGP